MGSVLIAMPKSEDAKRLKDRLTGMGMYHEIEVCHTAAEILRLAGEREYGVVICTKTLKDMSIIELEYCIPSGFGIILLTKDMTVDTDSGAVVKLPIPFKMSELISTVDMITAPYERKKKKSTKPRKRTEEEEKLILEAKHLLMERNGMTEPEAFRYIQKNSMDMGRTFVESAQMILTLNSQ
jgi:response regulator NasT